MGNVFPSVNRVNYIARAEEPLFLNYNNQLNVKSPMYVKTVAKMLYSYTWSALRHQGIIIHKPKTYLKTDLTPNKKGRGRKKGEL